jgi:hypothetical protein
MISAAQKPLAEEHPFVLGILVSGRGELPIPRRELLIKRFRSPPHAGDDTVGAKEVAHLELMAC